MDALERIGYAGLVPAAVIEDVEDAVPAARAVLEGGIDVMEIPFCPASAEVIPAILKAYPEMLVGVSGITALDQCKRAVAWGAGFILTPGCSHEVIAWCADQGVCVIPGCVTPTEVMAAIAHGLKVVGFFPARVYGGLDAVRALSGAFSGVRFLPAGVAAEELAEYAAAPFIHAVDCAFLCPKEDISARHVQRITDLCRAGRRSVLGFEVAHIGVNTPDEETSLAVCGDLEAAFGFQTKRGGSSNFAGGSVEVMKSIYLGKNGHIAIRTNSIPRAVAELQKHGFGVDEDTAKFKNGRMTAIYLKQEFGGFAVHLLQKS